MSQTERIFHILERLRSHNKVKTAQVASFFEVSSRTVKRDIEYIRDRLEYELIWSTKEGAYSLTPQDLGKMRQRGEEELLFFSLLMGFCRNHRLMPLVSQGIDDHFSQLLPPSYRELSKHISYDLVDYPAPPSRFFSLILKGMEDKRSMAMEYTTMAGSTSQRIIDPLHLKNWSGQWYLVAWCHTRSALRLFLLSRISHMSLEQNGFISSIGHEELRQRLNLSFGIMVELNEDRAPQYVVLRFTGKAARLTEGIVWHPEQETHVFENKREFTFPISSYEEILNVVFSYREEVEVIKPLELRRIWLEKIEKMAKNFL